MVLLALLGAGRSGAWDDRETPSAARPRPSDRRLCRWAVRYRREVRLALPGAVVAQEREHGEDASVIVSRGGQIELLEDAAHVLFDGVLGDDELFGDALVRASLGHQREHLALTRRELVEWSGSAATDESGDDLGVKRRATRGDTPHRVAELLEIMDAVLEEVAHALGAAADQRQGRLLGHVLRQDEHGGAGHSRAYRQRGAQAVIGVCRRHPYVGYNDVGAMRGGLPHEVVGITGLRDNLEAGLAEQADQAGAEQHLVFADYDAHGSCARTIVPRPGGLSTDRFPSRAPTRSPSPRSPLPCAGWAPPMPSSRTSTRTLSLDRETATCARVARECLMTLAIASATMK